MSPGLTRALFIYVSVLLTTTSFLSHAGGSEKVLIPHVNDKAHENFLQYQHAGKHRAFAIAPGGAWAWETDAVSEDQAKRQALKSCQAYTDQKCVLYALNDRIVFDAEAWPTLWGPYLSGEAVRQSNDGVNVGDRFPDLQWLDGQGNATSINDHQGKVIFLHFWGSWCPPCMREFPSIKRLQSEIDDMDDDIMMVALQLRETFEEAMNWARDNHFDSLPLYDSGVFDSEDTMINLSDGKKIADRKIARVFPSTYVIDKNGIVIFKHNGPIENWLEYVDFFKHAVSAVSSETVNN